ncbi:dihydrouridine synthase [Dictyocaulus viviparus]|uniref:Dihydrouridine synthase n=1 Tax=Dictyocaulus viviparus TaxID=29172 RepID=A0A0D8XMJ4_DICVI|nr:dihydrouridine synthase [Dictyocaulus viviparus]
MNVSDGSLFANKIIMAPMVRAGRTPLRLLALNYGADLCYTEEIIDQKLLSSTRIVNSILGTIDYALMDDIILRIASDESSRCVVQIGTNSGIRAAQVAKMVSTDVAAIDVNMGCPKSFSIHCGMGAALLLRMDKVKEVMTCLSAVTQVPVSCKIRLLDDLSATLNLVRVIENCGAAALAVHGRRRDERDFHPCRIDEIREIARTVSIPVIANFPLTWNICIWDGWLVKSRASVSMRTGGKFFRCSGLILSGPAAVRFPTDEIAYRIS